jgi:eukaryotic-like serine/threonine-protein kinase
VGSYVLSTILARGGFGTVCRAAHAELGTPAAVKLLHPYLEARPAVVLRFEREIDVISRIRHPNVVQILEHGRCADGSTFLVMELLEGVTLDHHLRTHGRLAPAEVLAILAPLVSALTAAHAVSVIHRDIKPTNVFLAVEGGRLRVVLLDFGVAKLLDTSEPDLTRSREIVGTYSAMSPEQILGRPVDARSDVYGLAVLAYRMLVGELPFQSNLLPLIQELHLYASPAPPSTRAWINPVFDDVILRGMSKAPADRHPTVGAFLESFRGAVSAHHATGDAARVTRRALAAYADVGWMDEALDAAEGDGEDRGAFLSAVVAELTAIGFSVAVETGGSVFLSLELSGEPAPDRELRRRTMEAALAVFRRAGEGKRVRLRLCIHVGEIVTTAEGTPVAGELLDVAAWVPDDAEEGVFASAEALAGLGIAPVGSVVGAGARLRIGAV